MTIDDLIQLLEQHFQEPQPSERWAMYRLITPVVDYANQSMGLNPYFEYNQTSSHGTHQSVDIALLDDTDTPRIFIEAKRADRKVSPEQIEKYLDISDRGVVTNGYIWILCFEGKHEAITLFQDRLVLDSLDKILDFITGSGKISGKVSTASDVYVNPVKPRRVVNKAKVSRPTHTVTVVSSQQEFMAFIDTAKNRPTNESALLLSIAKTLGQIPTPEYLKIETRKTRVSFSDERLSRNEKRMARIELGKAQPDLLIRTWVVDRHPEIADIAPPTIHDKGAHMRRFRLSSEEQAVAFGLALVSVLAKEIS
ncbi:MAG: hypothetical protein V7720_01615 [Halioglobus sp.]